MKNGTKTQHEVSLSSSIHPTVSLQFVNKKIDNERIAFPYWPRDHRENASTKKYLGTLINQNTDL